MTNKLKDKVCAYSKCDNMFAPRNGFHRTCGWQCAMDYTSEVKAKRAAKDKRKAVKEFKQNDKSTLMKVAQAVVNKYIRIRDANEPCISCQSPTGFRIEAGHYRSAGGHGSIRFNTLNIHAQDHRCNCHMSANLVPYRENLIKKIGLEKVEWLEAQNEPRKYTVEYLQKLIKVFRKKIKLIESRV